MRTITINIVTMMSLIFVFSSFSIEAASDERINMIKNRDNTVPCKKYGGKWNNKHKVCVGTTKPKIVRLCLDPNVNYGFFPICPEDVIDYMSVYDFERKYGPKKAKKKPKFIPKFKPDSCENKPNNGNSKLAQRCSSMGGTYCSTTNSCTINNTNLTAGCMWVIKNGQLTQACVVDDSAPSGQAKPPPIGKTVDYVLQVEGTAYCERNISRKGKKLKWWCTGPIQKMLLADEEDVIKQAKQSGCKFPRRSRGYAHEWVDLKSKNWGKQNAEGVFFYCGSPLKSYSRDIKKYMTVPRAFLQHRKVYGCPYLKWSLPKSIRKFYYDKSSCIHVEFINQGNVKWKTKKIKKNI